MNMDNTRIHDVKSKKNHLFEKLYICTGMATMPRVPPYIILCQEKTVLQTKIPRFLEILEME